MNKKSQAFNTRQTMVSKTFEVFHYKDAKAFEVPLHYHDFYEIYLFLDGNAEYRIDSNIYNLSPTNLLLFPPNIFHQPLISPTKTYERFVLWINDKYLKSITKDNKLLLNCFNNENYILNTGERFETINYLLSVIVSEQNKKDAYSKTYCNTLLISLLVEINRLSMNNSFNSVIKEENPIIHKILVYINDNFTQDIDLDKIAKDFYLNKYYLAHLFKTEIGTSIYQYILKKRLVYAHDLLENGYNPHDACNKSGFGDYTNFYRTFKSEYGTSPKFFYKNRVETNPQD